MNATLLFLFLAAQPASPSSSLHDASMSASSVSMPAMVVTSGPAFVAPVVVPIMVSVDPASPSSLVGVLQQAAKGKNWTLVMGAALMLLVLIARKVLAVLKPDVVPSRYMPYISLLLASVPTIALALMGDKVPWDELMGLFLSLWFMSGGMWSNSKALAKKRANAV